MRVALVSFAGTHRNTAGLASALRELGHQVVWYTRAEAPAWTNPDAEVVEIPSGLPERLSEREALPRLGSFADRLHDQLRERRLDVVHAHGPLAGLASQLALRGCSVPIVQTLSQLPSARPAAPAGPGQSPLVRAALGAERIVATSVAMQLALIRLGIPRSRIAVVPPGVDVQTLCPDGPAETRSTRFRLVLVGSLNQAHQAIQALAALPDTELVIASDELGGPEGAERLHQLAYQLKLVRRVRVAAMDDPALRAKLMRSADIALSLSQRGLVDPGVLEAMACGVPVAAGSAGATDPVVDGVTGLHVPEHNPRELAKTLRGLLANKALRVGMGIAARDRAVYRYSWARIAQETARIYRAAAEASRPGAARVPEPRAAASEI